ncbi:amidohydrolase family protein [Pseudorhodoferax sp.]|uniref:amidohydrolase family protein n=1 Tax=Pseudorhodoferax sp. TaxID=1993553 RepID=UPI002DD637E6|nr:amidohydrolase family protein [Pseudorhodoferax sp.]
MSAPAAAYLPFRAEVSRPRRPLPAGAADCHFHVFEGEAVHPYAEPRSYTPTPAPLAAYRHMADVLGLQRAVLVHPSVYGADHRSFEALLAANGGWMRGVAVVYPQTADADIERWHRLGARGTRCNALFAGGAQMPDLRAIVERVRPLGWHLQLLIDVERDPDLVPQMAALGVPVVVDHFGHVPAGRALASRGFNNLLAAVREGVAWVKLSGAYRISPQRRGYTDVRPLAEALLRANPAQLVWGSDWPHPAIQAPMPDDGHLADALLDGCSPGELQQVLVDNPTRLYWHDGPGTPGRAD